MAALATLAALAFAFYGLGDKSVWLDEAASISIARAPVNDFWTIVTTDQANQSLYYVLLRPWLALGDGEATVRALSVIWAVATVPVVYLLGTRLVGASVGVLAAWLVAVNAFVLQYAQEARGYTLLLFFGALSSYLLLRAVDSKRWALWIGYGIVAGLSVYVHFFAAFTIMAHFVSLGWKVSRLSWAQVVAGFGIAGVISLPIGIFILNSSGGQISWIATPTGHSMADALRKLAGDGSNVLRNVVVGLAALGMVAGFLARRPWPATLLAMWLVLPLAGSFAFSLLLKPIFQPQYLIGSTPALALLTAWGVVAIRPKALRLAALATVVALSLQVLPGFYSRPPKEDWRSATRGLWEVSDGADRVVIWAGFTRMPFDYYVNRLNLTAGAADPLYPPQSWGTFSFRDIGRSGTLDAAAEHLRVGDRVWLILSHSPTDLADVLATLGARAVSRTEFQGGIMLIEAEVTAPAG